MPKELKIILRETPIGLPPTPKQSAQREKFARAARAVAEEMEGTKLKGTARVRAFNTRVSQYLKTQGLVEP